MPVGNIGANCYFIVNEQTNEAICIDTGAEGEKICQLIEQNGWKLTGILLTHGHSDHIGATQYVKDHEKVNVYAAKAEEEVLAQPKLNLTTMFGNTMSLKADEWLEDGQEFTLAGVSIQCLLTAGHTKGGMCKRKDRIYRRYPVLSIHRKNRLSNRRFKDSRNVYKRKVICTF